MSASSARGRPSFELVHGVADAEHGALLDWLGAGLRPDHPAALVAEYPLVLAHGADHVVARSGGRFLAHALGRRLVARAGDRRVPVGVIGLVYTDPAERGRGLARACTAAAAERLAREGALVIALWTDLDALYAPLGFRRAGRERWHPLEPGACAAAREGRPPVEVGAPRDDDWPALEAFQAAHPARIERPAGALARLAAIPGCTTHVARRAGRPIAFACAGRGADLRGVVHEWGGDPDGVLACLEALARAGATRWHAGPVDSPVAARLRAAGSTPHEDALALVRIPDPPALWDALLAGDRALAGVRLERDGAGFALCGARGRARLSPAETTALLLGPQRPTGAAAALDARQWLALRARLPWPLYFWGFDSI